MNRFVISALLGLAVGTPALAQQSSSHRHSSANHHTAPKWHEAYRDKTVVVSVDPAGTRRRDDGTYMAHLHWAYTADQPIGRGRVYRTMAETLLLDCDSLRTKPLSGETFDRHGGKISSYDTPASDTASLDWLKRDPESTGGKALTGVCRSITKGG